MHARVRGLALAVLGSLALCFQAAPVSAQINEGAGFSRYDIYGPPADVSIDDLVNNSTAYENRAVHTKGRFDILPVSGSRVYALRGTFTAQGVMVIPVPDVAAEFEAVGGMRWIGSEIELTGVFATRSNGGIASPNDPTSFVIQFWSFVGPEEKQPDKTIKSTQVTLEALVSKPGTHDGQTVRVVGKFRGRNLYGDLPSHSQRASSDWVIKDDLFAVWVAGKKPKGSGWELDAGLKRDTGKWIEVIGKPETRDGVTYIRALTVNITTPPTATAEVAPPSPPPPRPKVPPVVVFALPLDGESDVPRDSRFVVQFNKDMDEKTFSGHVMLRYAGAVRPGDRGFDGVKMTYDNGRRALVIDPGDVLRPGRQIDLLLLPGIQDIDGMDLIPRKLPLPDAASPIVDALHFRVSL